MSVALWRRELQPLRVTILDRYMVGELMGPLMFGLSTFTLIFCATQILAIGKLVSEEHASLIAAIEYFFWDMPQFLLLVVPMSMLLGTLLSLQRLSGESEITAMKAGGISLTRIVTPLCIIGLIVSVLALMVQENLVPLANDRAAYIKEAVIKHLSPAAGNLTVVTPLPGGGKQVTIAGALDGATQSLIDVTVLRYDPQQRVSEMIQSDRAEYSAPTWTFHNATTFEFGNNEVTATLQSPTLAVDIGERPNQVAKQNLNSGDPENLSRGEIRDALNQGVLSDGQRRTFTATYAAKLARPFASFVFVLIAVPFGLRQARGGKGLGLGLAIVIVFVYYIVMSICLSLGSIAVPLAGIAAWTPNLLFSLIGLRLLTRASAV